VFQVSHSSLPLSTYPTHRLHTHREEVASRTFPGLRYSPYTIKPNEVNALEAELAASGLPEVAAAVRAAADEEAAARADPDRQW